jgi:predicted dehydrogenase/nucleoside-diphosphate-sugar epimerase
MAQARVGLVGAGFIAATHLEAIRLTGNLSVAAVIDPNLKAAERLAHKAPGARAFSSLAEAIAAKAIDRVHVLVPPQHHKSVAAEALNAGLPTLVEKPLAVSAVEAAELSQLARERKVTLGVNQNFMFDPDLTRFANELAAGKYGRLRHVSAICAVPLRQLAARQFGHWMFERPSNIILEQMVHPLSQLVRLLGPLTVTSATAKPPMELGPGLHFHQAFDVSFTSASGTAQLHMAFAEAYPASQLNCLCDDGLIVVDAGRHQLIRYGRTRFLEQGDTALVSARAGASQIRQACTGVATYLAAQLKLTRRSDAFFRSMLASIQSFHRAVDNAATPTADGALGEHLVRLCDDVRRIAGVSDRPVSPPRTLIARQAPVPAFDVAVLGGTGFIGKATVEHLTKAGYSVGVMARGMRGLPEVFQSPSVTLIEGDVTKKEDVVRGIGRAKFVVNLAHGGASGSRDAIVGAIVGSADAVAHACLEQGIQRLIHISSIAALYLGDEAETITHATLADPQGAERADYSFAKAEAERRLLALHKQKGLPVVIHRPGVVVGDGASPFHSGVGLFNNEQHCLGWTNGNNPLPFVLVDDCASAIVCALKASDDVIGRTDNIVGPVRLTAREYFYELSRALERPLKFHGGALWRMQSVELAKWLIKRAGGNNLPMPSARDLRSRGLRARFDTAGTERALDWNPVADRAVFLRNGVRAPALAQRTS